MHPNRAGVPIYQIPQSTVVFFPPPVVPPEPPPIPPIPPDPPEPPVTTYHNTEQTCTDTCPGGTTGSPISVTVTAGNPAYDSIVSQEVADAAALAAACAEAAQQRELQPCVDIPPPEGVPCDHECRSADLSATLIGCSEYSPFESVPPRKYRIKAASGVSWTRSYFGDDTCTTPVSFPPSPQCTYTSYIQYDAFSGATSHGGNLSCINTSDPGSNPVVEDGLIFCGTPGGSDCFSFWTIDSATVASRHTTGACCGNQKTVSETLQVILSDEDTEDDAETRALIAADPVPWVEGSCETQMATRELRGAGQFDFTFTAAQFRVTIGSVEEPLTIGVTYQVAVQTERRLAGSADPFLPFAQIDFELEAEGATQMSDWIAIPNAAGYETRVSECSAGI